VLFATWLVRQHIITADCFVRIVALQAEARPRIGRLALESGELTVKQVFHILKEQVNSEEPFGEIAVRLNFLTPQQVTRLLWEQHQQTPTFSECMLELGMLDEERLRLELQRFHRAGHDPHDDIGRSAFECVADCGSG